jgi:hypothetical protein
MEMRLRDNWRYTMCVLLVTAVPLGTAFSQSEERAEEDSGNIKVECDAFTLEGIMPGMKFTEVEDLLKARSPRPQSASKHRRYDSARGWQAVHSWQVAGGTIEVWFKGKKANRKLNPTAVRVRLLREPGVSKEALWQETFDRFGPMSNWERDDCDIKAVVGLERDRPHTTLTLMSWEHASKEAED